VFEIRIVGCVACWMGVGECVSASTFSEGGLASFSGAGPGARPSCERSQELVVDF
jgi:hypothetical protein